MSQVESSALAALLLTLEQQLMYPDVRKDRTKVSALLAEDFREFGSSGRNWSREAILDDLATESTYTEPIVEDFAIQQLAANIVLVTYRTVRPESSSLRSSIWVERRGQWQVLFHQGTKIPQL